MGDGVGEVDIRDTIERILAARLKTQLCVFLGEPTDLNQFQVLCPVTAEDSTWAGSDSPFVKLIDITGVSHWFGQLGIELSKKGREA